MADRKKVLICVPRWGVDPPECADFRQALCYMLGYWEAQPDCPYVFKFGTLPDMLVQLTRDLAAAEAVRGGYDFLGMIDDDMLGPQDAGAYVNLWKSLLEDDVDMVAPLAFMRNPPHYPVCFALHGGWDAVSQRESYTNDVIKNYPKNTLFECDAVGFGAVLIKTSVIRGVGPPYFMSSAATGEDILFCVKARKKGFRVFCDSRLILKHLGPRVYVDEEYFEKHDPEIRFLREACGEWTRDKANANLAS